jgi:hypothetical protein
MFDWRQPVYHWLPTVDVPSDRKLLGRWLDIAKTSVNELAYYILSSTGKVLTQKSIWVLTADELQDPEVRCKLESYDVAINITICDSTIDTVKFPELDLFHPQDCH